ncbi:Reticulon-3 [Porphyridium purpureum]|uniref:Reticulon-like protein n=1 Tax=Porphyridium purpureum TaxID=35688 RepID=A0A5J4YHN8_PORPP|nr:Reticulon-3 [Porphyridium purpureum]|eukprot:POR4078..scf267_23
MEGDEDAFTAAPAAEYPDVPDVVKSVGQSMQDGVAAAVERVENATSSMQSAPASASAPPPAANESAGMNPLAYLPKVELPVAAKRPVTTLNDVIYWRNPLVTGIVFGTFNVVFMLVLFGKYSFLRVFSSAAVFYLLLGLLIVNGSKLLVGFTEKARIPQPSYGAEYIDKKVWLPRIEKSIATVNKTMDVLIAALYCVDSKRTLQLMVAFYLLSLVGRVIPDAVLIYLVGLTIFTAPVVYENYKEEIDVHLVKIKKMLQEYYAKGKAAAEEKAVELRKVADVKMAELKEQVQQKSQPLLEQSGVAKKLGLSPAPKKTQ